LWRRPGVVPVVSVWRESKPTNCTTRDNRDYRA
jgi:hypothetical protein